MFVEPEEKKTSNYGVVQHALHTKEVLPENYDARHSGGCAYHPGRLLWSHGKLRLVIFKKDKLYLPLGVRTLFAPLPHQNSSCNTKMGTYLLLKNMFQHGG